MRILYTVIWILALPLVVARLFWRGRKEPGYRAHIAERFGLFNSPSIAQDARPVIWVHAVSVGETRAAEPLIRQLNVAYPKHRILLSHMTPTGRATGALLFPHGEVEQCFLPYDIPFLVQRLVHHFQPKICILMETEVWPNLIYTCKKNALPVALVNARLSPKSLKKALRLSRLILPASAAISCVAAQTKADAERIRQLGTPNVVVTGNNKFDVSPQPEQIAAGLALRTQLGTRPVLLCASTREGEEELILDAFIQAKLPKVLLVIVPRHPQRFDAVEQLIKQHGLLVQRRSTLDSSSTVGPEINVFLGDSMGEMPRYYASCDVAFIGGSLMPLGGQNLIEACALEKPVLIGPHTFNFDAVSTDAIDAGGALRVADAHELMAVSAQLIEDQEHRLAIGKAALAFAEQHRGATARTMALLADWIK